MCLVEFGKAVTDSYALLSAEEYVPSKILSERVEGQGSAVPDCFMLFQFHGQAWKVQLALTLLYSQILG